MKVQMFLSTALTMWDADFYVKADDNVHVNIGMQRWDPFAFDQPSIVLVHHTVIWGALFNTGITRSILARHRMKPRVYIGCMKSGPVVAKK
jgi:beta-1,6-galactosyltransferase